MIIVIKVKLIVLTLFETGGVQHPPYCKLALGPQKRPPNYPKFHDFSFFYMTFLKISLLPLILSGCLPKNLLMPKICIRKMASWCKNEYLL